MSLTRSGLVIAAAVFAAAGASIAEPPSKSTAHASGQPAAPAAASGVDGQKDTAYVLHHTVKTIDGQSKNLAEYQGKVVMIVNVASKCGFTRQYTGLQKLFTENESKGFVVLGFPANNFGGQEPGTNAEIAEFCSRTYNVTFPMFEKISVTGADQHPLYKQLASQPTPIGGDPKWNFTKFLVDRSGRVVARYDSRVAPDSPELVKKVQELLAEGQTPSPKTDSPTKGS